MAAPAASPATAAPQPSPAGHTDHSGQGAQREGQPQRHDHPAPAETPQRRMEDPRDPVHSAGSAATHAAPGAHAGHTSAGTEASVAVSELVVMSDVDMGLRLSPSNTISMGQMASGTGWQPASTPMHMWHTRSGEWFLMFHANAFIGVNSQGGPRGTTRFESQNWFMPMAFRRVGPGVLQLRGMFSFEPFTFPRGGSGQLFQTGETYRGEPIIDAQHPHDLFMELAASYTVPVGERGTWFAYVGLPGEPALGPPAFMHRWSASENPAAVLSHHYQDSTHIAYGVFTTGFTYRGFKLEGSLFNGREPDENRYDIEFNPWNSRSVRVSYAPNANWAMQWSYGYLRNPEALHVGDTQRMTASVMYNRPFARGNWASAVVWGRNREEHSDEGEVFRLNGYTFESTVNFLDRNYLYTRLELADKKDLLRHDDLHRLGFDDHAHPQFRIGAYTFGAARDIWNTARISLAVGGDFTFYSKPDMLDTIYGRNPTSFRLFLRIRPGRMSHQTHTTHGAHTAP